MAINRGPRIGELLLSSGAINQSQLMEALAEQQRMGGKLGQVMVDMKVVAPNTLIGTLSKAMNVKGCVLRHGLIDPQIAKIIDREEAERLKVLPMFKVRDRLTVAMADPQSLPVIDRLARLTGCEINPVLALEDNIEEYRQKYLVRDVNVESFLASLGEADLEVVEREDQADHVSADIDCMVDGSPIVNLVNIAVLTAVREGASDIHIEPDRKGTRVRYRVDGMLRPLMTPPTGMHAAIVSRVKVIGHMDIAEKRIPQEGRVRVVADGREVDLRISTIPTVLGEKVVLRILDRANLDLSLEALGLKGYAMDAFTRMISRPHGLVLVTGPTGSGKTTTLYAAIDHLRSTERNIVTVEDPVEYQLDMINQVQIHEQIGLTFSRALRSILRQDPDVILLGEIRDSETARVAVQAALTGHLVLSTLHTNDSPSAITRLVDMGIESYLLSSAINGVIAQRLARTICPKCRTVYFPAPAALQHACWLNDPRRKFWKGEGCNNCHDSGFQGRSGIYEILEVDDRIRSHIEAGHGDAEIRTYLSTRQWKSLREVGLELVEQGVSTLEEVLRVTLTEHEDRIRAEGDIADNGQQSGIAAENENDTADALEVVSTE